MLAKISVENKDGQEAKAVCVLMFSFYKHVSDLESFKKT